AATGAGAGTPKVLDTSVIIDGRILDIVGSGFLEGPLLLPRFVLRELQATAPLEIVERDYDGAADVDAKLVLLARERSAKLVTNDFNLNRVANVEGIA